MHLPVVSYIRPECWRCGLGVGGGGIGLGGGDHSRAEVSIGPLNGVVACNCICRQANYIAPYGKLNWHAKKVTCNCICLQKDLHLAFAKSAGNRAEGV